MRHERNFNQEDYENSSDITPVIIGFNLSHTYSLNQVYSFKNGGSGEQFQGEIVGILPKNTVYPFLQNISSTVQLDNSYIIPLTDQMIANDFQVPDFDMALSNTIITTSDKSVLDEIVTESNKTNLFSLNFLSVQNAVSNYIDYMTPQIVYQLVTAIIILIFACIGMISHLITMISKQQKDYGIHILCRARIKGTILRLFIQVGIIIIVSFVPCLLIMGLSKSLLLTLLIELLISFVIMVFPMIKLYSLSIPQIIRRSE